jgi:hypothetical protein
MGGFEDALLVRRRKSLARRFRLGAPKCLFQRSDRIDQIAAATAVASTDRSKSRWKNKTNEQKKEEEMPPKLILNPNLLNQ